MSYNVSHWKTKMLEGLQFRTSALQKGTSFEIRSQENGELRARIRVGERDGIMGVLRVDTVSVAEIDCSGEFSGNDYNDILLPLLRRSKGKLEAVLIWEGGDYISRLNVSNGEVTEEKVDL